MLTQGEDVEVHALRKRGWSYVAITPASPAGLLQPGSTRFVVIDEPTIRAVSVDHVKAAAGVSPGAGSATVVVVRAVDRAAPLPSPLGMDTTLVFSIEQFALGIFPAIDPIRSDTVLVRAPVAEAARQAMSPGGRATRLVPPAHVRRTGLHRRTGHLGRSARGHRTTRRAHPIIETTPTKRPPPAVGAPRR